LSKKKKDLYLSSVGKGAGNKTGGKGVGRNKTRTRGARGRCDKNCKDGLMFPKTGGNPRAVFFKGKTPNEMGGKERNPHGPQGGSPTEKFLLPLGNIACDGGGKVLPRRKKRDVLDQGEGKKNRGGEKK